jgi:hypothetical protein
MRTLAALALIALSPAAALAQQADQAPPPPPPPAETPAQPDAPPATPEAAPAQATGPTVEERLTHVEGKLEGMEEGNAATNATVDALKKIKVSGYIQGRYEWHDDAAAGVDPATNKQLGTNRFLVRRGRLKVVYQGHLTEYLLQTDATPDGVTLKDAEASLVLDDTVFPSPTPWEVKLTLGQFKAPFGFEITQSSADREMPERTRMIRVLFPGERDRGARLTAKYGALRFSSALINGNVFPALSTFSKVSTSSGDPIAGSTDQSSFKDVLGRVGADLGFLVFGGSFYYGHTIATTLAKAASGSTPASPPSYLRYQRLRLGVDAQAYYEIPGVGGGVLRGEFIYAPEKNLDYAGVTKDPCRDQKALGWYATLVQNIGSNFGVVFRADQFNKNSSVNSGCADAVKTAADIDRVTTLGGGLLVFFSGNLKATAVYEHFIEQGANKSDNDAFTLQLQARF